MKKVLFLAMASVMVFAFAATAVADPTVLPPDPDPPASHTPATPTVIADDGGSRWSYQDAADATAKREGGYLPFNAGTIYAADGSAYATTGAGVPFWNQALFAGKGPHGGYDTSTNKCKACHAVHRAEGTYYLLRADTQDDACNYCHIGAGAKSAEVVYTGNTAGIDTPNGHTMGASSRIPGSTVSMATTTMIVNNTPVLVRTYVDERKQLFRTVARGRTPASHPLWRTGGAGGLTPGAGMLFGRVGPTPLSCSNCHQVHNAVTQIWQPPIHGTARNTVETTQAVAGYKLLRRFPGATTWTDGGRVLGLGPFDTRTMAKVPESTLLVNATYSTTRSGAAAYQDTTADGDWWRQPDWVLGADLHNQVNDDGTLRHPEAALVSEQAMSVWCADCHNLNIGAPGSFAGDPELGVQKLHGDRTHPVPASRAMQCYSCHRSGLGHGGTSCGMCHYGPDLFRTDSGLPSITFAGFPLPRPTDFPHAGADDEYKLLGAFSVSALPPAVTQPVTWMLSYRHTVITPDNLDAVCIRCHTDHGIHQ